MMSSEPISVDEKDKSGAIVVSLLSDPAVNYASYQNHVPLVRSLTLTNISAETLRNLEVLIRCEPAFAESLKLQFEQLVPGEVRRIDALDLKFHHSYLAGLNEAERGHVSVEVLSGGESLAKKDHAVDVLAYDQWAGTRSLPELLAAFSLPNNPAVDRLIYSASEVLSKSERGRSMNGYQSKNRDDVWAQISALYSAIVASNLHYSEPPASFGTDGQKIRTPDRILSGGIATCLDLAMLMASGLEQAGLNPVVLVKQGHAWVGCWLINTSLPTAVFDDGQALRKRVAGGELLVFETTGLAQRPAVSLRLACELGLKHLDDEREFLFAVDVKRCRMQQILPLPIRAEGGIAERVAESVSVPQIERPPELPPLDGEAILLDEDAPPETPQGRLARWKSKLLDLTLRNRLINFKPTKTTLPLRVADPAHLEDVLSEGEEWKFRPLPQIMQGDDPRVASVAIRRTGEDPIEALSQEAAKQGELLAMVESAAMDSRLYELYSAARLGLEEGGANTLYLAIGFLRWAEDERAEKTHLAPLLLVPVTLTRQSVRAGYAIKRHDDETIVNPTLLQLLRENFQLTLKGIEQLPTDESGVDVRKIWQIFRAAVKEIPRWEVIEDVYLGIFSFTKYLMWKDLQDRTEQLKKNRVVEHLIERPRQAIGGDADLAAREDLDERHAPDALLTPLLADSSQLNAVSRAGAGHDFALEGPPGTGKSQTITNLIAHFLGHGKTVLFVSEKMAALDVVQRRLNSIGLGAFCLELHSAKARKLEVLQQLRAPMESSSRFSQEGWKRETQRLASLRAGLNDFVRALHHQHRNGLTVRGAMDTAIRHRGWTAAEMPWLDPDEHDEAGMEGLLDLTRTIQSIAGELGQLKDHPLAAIQHTEWSNAWESRFLKGSAQLHAAAKELQSSAVALGVPLGLKLESASSVLLDRIEGLVDVLLAAPQIPPAVIAHAGDAAVRSQMQALRGHGERRQTQWAKFADAYSPEIIALDAEVLTNDWRSACVAWWPKSWFAQRAVTARFVHCRKDGKRPQASDMTSLLTALRALRSEDKALADLSDKALQALGSEYRGADTDWRAVKGYEQWSQEFEEAVGRFASGTNTQVIEALSQRLRKLCTDQRMALVPGGVLAQRLVTFRNKWRALKEQIQTVAQTSAAGDSFAGDTRLAGLTSRLQSLVSGWHSSKRWLQLWCRWRDLRGQALNRGLGAIVAKLEEGEVSAADLENYTRFSYETWWLKGVVDREPVLRTFSSADHERKIREFREADERFQELTKQYIVAVLAGKVPKQQAGQKPDAELALVLRELAKQRAHLPVRKLVHGIPTLLPRLKPCLLMSPLSVAQYLDAAHSSFDVVVFDEASQIPVWDAVGAIARGKQLVVVGDPKQLPPTSFFSRADNEDESDADVSEDAPIKDLESILDECLGAGLPTLRLEWHYRSRHESLITFSNHRYYESRLVTFPSPVTQDMAVRLEVVPGVYDRGGSRTNLVEADAVVREIIAHFSDESRRRQTLGVVTFNQPQQRLIETLLDQELTRLPDIESHIAEHGPERLFVKNLENVQGDERDVILFSITYGKDAAGRMPMNFGPLNQEGGHRRLNVAITRARVGVVIFSSIRPEEIDLSRTRASGVTDLKNYLEFASRGARALVEQSTPTGLEPESPFEMEVIRALRDKGWTVHPQVGCSGYRVDMAVVHPGEPGRYVLGIECDGASYHSLPTARDRDRLRQVVLEGLGWKLHRIWSTDWWTDSEREMQKLERVLNMGLEAHSH
jgi:very-short-patch-repair endonuclease